jgi:hypothetical protein
MRAELGFKHEEEAVLRHQFRTATHPILQAILFGAAFWLWVNHSIVLTITCLRRTPDSNKAAGGKPTSRHLETPCPAVDIRIRDLSKEAITGLIDYLTKTWGDMLYILLEPDHLHLQLSRAKFPPNNSLKNN